MVGLPQNSLMASSPFQLVPLFPLVSSSPRWRQLSHYYEHSPCLTLREEKSPFPCFKVTTQKRHTSYSLTSYWPHLTVRKAEKSHLKWEVMCQQKLFLGQKRRVVGGGYLVAHQDQEWSIEDDAVFAVESRLILFCHFCLHSLISMIASYQLSYHLGHGLCGPRTGNFCCSWENLLHDSIHFIEVDYSQERQALFKTSAPFLLFFSAFEETILTLEFWKWSKYSSQFFSIYLHLRELAAKLKGTNVFSSLQIHQRKNEKILQVKFSKLFSFLLFFLSWLFNGNDYYAVHRLFWLKK